MQDVSQKTPVKENEGAGRGEERCQNMMVV